MQKILINERQRSGGEVGEKSPEHEGVINAPRGGRAFVRVGAAGASALQVAQAEGGANRLKQRFGADDLAGLGRLVSDHARSGAAEPNGNAVEK